VEVNVNVNVRRLGLACLLAACNSTPSGPTVRITFFQDGAPKSGAPVWFGDPQTGRVIADGTTDDSGTFSAHVPLGASVSAASRDSGDPPLFSVYSISSTQPGDDLRLGDQQVFVSATHLGSVNVTLPGPQAGATFYDANIGCQGNNSLDAALPIVVPVFSDCLAADGKLVVVARALDAAMQPLGYALTSGVAPPAAGGDVSVTLGPWRTDFTQFAMTLAGVPADAGSVQSQVVLIANGARFDQGLMTATMPAAGGPLTQSFTFPPGLATRLVWKQLVGYGSGGAIDGFQALVASSGAAPLPVADTLDLAAALPRISSPTGAIAANGSPALSWQAAGDLTSADGLIAFATWINPNNSHVRWLLLAPPSAETTLAFPELPDALKTARGVLAVPVSPAIYAVEADHIASYDDFRRGPGPTAVIGESVPTSDLRVRISSAGMVRF
jgi:hypothetical protein